MTDLYQLNTPEKKTTGKWGTLPSEMLVMTN